MRVPTLSIVLCLPPVLVFKVVCQSECSSTCPNGWTVNNDSCYLFGHGVAMTFVEAVHFCHQHYADIVQIESYAENLFVKDYLMRLKVNHYWVGLTDEMVENVWQWYGNDEPVKFFDWAPNEPNGQTLHRGDEDCVVFSSSVKYQWVDVACSGVFHLVCEKRMSNPNEIIG